ncbi:hypothetical protein GX50_03818 [[Emmonsia] crescens]|uniref:Uncharacterized protein n=1 Tax=[Emmonsia] crescens TaxID=73230 RepID=A0A2B7ZJ09_9EURO|nr:hypothetical protein GX50_03818 [Emmonsia crescens]
MCDGLTEYLARVHGDTDSHICTLLCHTKKFPWRMRRWPNVGGDDSFGIAQVACTQPHNSLIITGAGMGISGSVDLCSSSPSPRHRRSAVHNDALQKAPTMGKESDGPAHSLSDQRKSNLERQVLKKTAIGQRKALMDTENMPKRCVG